VAPIEVLTPPGVLNRAAQRQLVAEGGWGISGTALGREEFAALAGSTTDTATPTGI